MADAGTGGWLRLDFACAASGVTQLVERSQRFPLHVTSALRLDPAAPNMAFVYLQNPSGGVFEADRLAIELHLRRNASVHVSTPSATKLFGAEGGVSASQRMTIDMQEGAYLEYIPDPLIPLRKACYEQETLLRMATGACAIMTEIVACGRFTAGEAFAYSRLEFRTEVKIDGIATCRDAFELTPQTMPLAGPGLFGEHRFVATMLVLCPGALPAGLDRRMDDAVRSLDAVYGAASLLPGKSGVIVRALAATPSAARSVVNLAWEEARRSLLGLLLPPIRK